jgi:squalene-hopene/tetraprenyl-beta-curcumene cyclase
MAKFLRVMMAAMAVGAMVAADATPADATPPATAADAAPMPVGPDKARVEALIDAAQTWLLAQQQANGAFMRGNQFVLGITALSAEALATAPKALPADQGPVAKALALLLSQQQADGGIYSQSEGLGNYTTSITLMALAAAGKLDANKEAVQKAQHYLFGLQRSDDPSGLRNGGIGYDQTDGPGHEDLTNTNAAIMGLRASGIPADDPHMKAALAFIQRCQNLSSVNPAPWAASNDGSGVYSPDETKAGESWQSPADKANPTVRLDGTGSMTYSLLESYLALDLKPGDPRVDAALAWVKVHFQFDGNPGMAAGREHQGLFYYYVFMGKTLDLLHIQSIEIAPDLAEDWRLGLFNAINRHATMVDVAGKPGAMWINDAPRWGEGLPQLGTVYMLKALKVIDAELP